MGRPVIAFSACRLPRRDMIDHQRLLQYVIIFCSSILLLLFPLRLLPGFLLLSLFPLLSCFLLSYLLHLVRIFLALFIDFTALVSCASLALAFLSHFCSHSYLSRFTLFSFLSCLLPSFMSLASVTSSFASVISLFPLPYLSSHFSVSYS